MGQWLGRYGKKKLHELTKPLRMLSKGGNVIRAAIEYGGQRVKKADGKTKKPSVGHT